MEDPGSPKTTNKSSHGGSSILLPADAMMPVRQPNHRLDARFLPFFARYLPPGALVVDAGAYGGDTIPAMRAANPRLRFVCIEGDGDAAFRGQLQALDGILQAEQVGRVWLLKSDTGGRDSDLPVSAGELLRRDCPMLFFKCETHSAGDMTAFLELFARLGERGYVHWVLLDDSGTVMWETSDLDLAGRLLDSARRQNQSRSSGTPYSFDILAATRVDRRIVTRIVAAYKELA